MKVGNLIGLAAVVAILNIVVWAAVIGAVEELCAGTLAHYDGISTKACHWNNQVPQAIKFWYLEKPKLELALSAARRDAEMLERRIRAMIGSNADDYKYYVNACQQTIRALEFRAALSAKDAKGGK